MTRLSRILPPLLALAALLAPAPAAAAGFDAAGKSLVWALPFAGILLSIAIMPLAVPGFWHHHFGKVAAFWALAFLVPCAVDQGIGATFGILAHVMLEEYIPFILLLLALFTVAGGIGLSGRLGGTAASNTAMLAAGTALAGWMGTTGASMLLIRPLIKANRGRPHQVHLYVFFIFLVSNIGGALTPLGDPPLFLAFLQGIRFEWFISHIFVEMLVCVVPLLIVFYLLDRWRFAKDGAPRPGPAEPFRLTGWINVALLGAVVAAVLLRGVWRSGVSIDLAGVHMSLEAIALLLLLAGIAGVSQLVSSKEIREANEFSWAPIVEVAKLFAGIFVTIVPCIAILAAGDKGALGWLLAIVNPGGEPSPALYFWITGGLSSFLDNAPSWLVMYNAAGGGAERMMGPLVDTLVAISCGAVFMGANSYIGNAPNFMVKAICEERGIRMPSFFGYIGWATVFLVPLFLVVTLIFF